MDGVGKADGFLEPGSRCARRTCCARLRSRFAAQIGLDDDGTPGLYVGPREKMVGSPVEPTRLQLGPFPGRVLLGRFEELNGVTRHNGRYGVFVDELRVSIAPEQYAEVIEPGDHALQLDPVHQKDREWSLVLADVVEKGILQVL
jgi:hypothetical protein